MTMCRRNHLLRDEMEQAIHIDDVERLQSLFSGSRTLPSVSGLNTTGHSPKSRGAEQTGIDDDLLACISPVAYGRGGDTLLHHAARYNSVKCAKYLLEKSAGSQIDIADVESGWTPLHQALYSGHLVLASLLCSRGSNASLRDRNGCSAFDVFYARGFTELGMQTLWESQHERNLSGSSVHMPPHCRTLCYAIGSAKDHQLGVNISSSKLVQQTPRLVSSLKGHTITQLQASRRSSMVTTSAGTLVSWGVGHGCGLGHGDEKTHILPRVVDAGPLRKRRMACASSSGTLSSAIDTEGQLYVWGTFTPHGVSGHTNGSGSPQAGPLSDSHSPSLSYSSSPRMSGSPGSPTGLDDSFVLGGSPSSRDSSSGGNSQASGALMWPTPSRIDLRPYSARQVACAGARVFICTTRGELFLLGQRLDDPSRAWTQPQLLEGWKGSPLAQIVCAPQALLALTEDGDVLQHSAGESCFHKCVVRKVPEPSVGVTYSHVRAMGSRRFCQLTCSERYGAALSTDGLPYWWSLCPQSSKAKRRTSSGVVRNSMEPITALRHQRTRCIGVGDGFLVAIDSVGRASVWGEGLIDSVSGEQGKPELIEIESTSQIGAVCCGEHHALLLQVLFEPLPFEAKAVEVESSVEAEPTLQVPSLRYIVEAELSQRMQPHEVLPSFRLAVALGSERLMRFCAMYIMRNSDHYLRLCVQQMDLHSLAELEYMFQLVYPSKGSMCPLFASTHSSSCPDLPLLRRRSADCDERPRQLDRIVTGQDEAIAAADAMAYEQQIVAIAPSSSVGRSVPCSLGVDGMMDAKRSYEQDMADQELTESSLVDLQSLAEVKESKADLKRDRDEEDAAAFARLTISELQNRVRSTKKKLTAIDNLVRQRDVEPHVNLNPQQIAKLASKGTLERRLKRLEGILSVRLVALRERKGAGAEDSEESGEVAEVKDALPVKSPSLAAAHSSPALKSTAPSPSAGQGIPNRSAADAGSGKKPRGRSLLDIQREQEQLEGNRRNTTRNGGAVRPVEKETSGWQPVSMADLLDSATKRGAFAASQPVKASVAAPWSPVLVRHASDPTGVSPCKTGATGPSLAEIMQAEAEAKRFRKSPLPRPQSGARQLLTNRHSPPVRAVARDLHQSPTVRSSGSPVHRSAGGSAALGDFFLPSAVSSLTPKASTKTWALQTPQKDESKSRPMSLSHIQASEEARNSSRSMGRLGSAPRAWGTAAVEQPASATALTVIQSMQLIAEEEKELLAREQQLQEARAAAERKQQQKQQNGGRAKGRGQKKGPGNGKAKGARAAGTPHNTRGSKENGGGRGGRKPNRRGKSKQTAKPSSQATSAPETVSL